MYKSPRERQILCWTLFCLFEQNTFCHGISDNTMSKIYFPIDNGSSTRKWQKQDDLGEESVFAIGLMCFRFRDLKQLGSHSPLCSLCIFSLWGSFAAQVWVLQYQLVNACRPIIWWPRHRTKSTEVHQHDSQVKQRDAFFFLMQVNAGYFVYSQTQTSITRWLVFPSVYKWTCSLPWWSSGIY